MRVYVCRVEYGEYTENFKRHNCIGIGWFDDDPELNNWNLNNRDFLKIKYRERYLDDADMRVHQNVGQIYRFLHQCHVGDIIITPYKNHELLIGILTNDFIFQRDDGFPYTWRKRVEWKRDQVNRREFSISLQNSLRSSLTFFCNKSKRGDISNFKYRSAPGPQPSPI